MKKLFSLKHTERAIQLLENCKNHVKVECRLRCEFFDPAKFELLRQILVVHWVGDSKT